MSTEFNKHVLFSWNIQEADHNQWSDIFSNLHPSADPQRCSCEQGDPGGCAAMVQPAAQLSQRLQVNLAA